ncbi:MAG: SH3 domain-containing protein [Bacilli bacterium]|nr:SH3 domain-containing protein [Bacilli bacterium]
MKKINFIFIFLFILALVSCTTPTTYKVTFNDMNGEIIETKEISNGQTLSYPAPPKVEGYKFVSWTKDVNSTSSNVIYNATYDRLKFKVVFYDFNNQILDQQEVYYGESANDPEDKLEINDFVFFGWDKEFESVKSNLEVKPLFDDNKYIVKYYDALGEVLLETEVNYGEKVDAPNAPEKEGYIFKGWSAKSDNVTNDLSIYPIYEIIVYTVTFYDEFGSVIAEQYIEYGKSATSPTLPPKEGYKFVKWDEKITNIKSNLEVYPIYEEIIYEVRFVDMYNNIIKTEELRYGEDATPPTAPTISYYTFNRWDQDYRNVTKNMTIKAIYNKENNSYNTSTADYWLYQLSSKYDIEKTLLSDEGINSFNQKVLSDYSLTEVKDVLAIPDTATNSFVKNMIEAYTNINKYTVYNHETNQALTSSEKTEILNNRNLNNIPKTVNVKYGIITDFAWMRSYPTNHYSSKYSMDRFQETTLNVGEGVAIYHISLDGEWLYVQAENYNGWVEAKYIAECSFDALEAFANPAERVLVISDYVVIEGSHVRMGQSFPLVSSNESTYTINFPTRTLDGKLELKEIVVNNDNNYSLGYLKYNYKNVFTQAFKLLGIDYSWGDKEKDGRDCSSTMNAIYRCFGFMMPRNTTNQVAIPSFGSKVSGLSNSSIKNYKPGTMIFTSGHVMLYIGENASGEAYLLHNTTSGNGECILQSLNSYGGSKIIGVLQMQ